MAGMDHTGKAGAGGEFAQQATNWATPRASMATNGSDSGSARRQLEGLNIGLKDQAKQWPTPSAALAGSGGSDCSEKRRPENLASFVKTREAQQQWPTPAANEYEGGDPNKMLERREREKLKGRNGNGFGLTLGMSVAQWPTPAARDGKGTNSEEHALVTGGGRKHMDQLANFVAYSPQVQPIRDGQESSQSTPNSPRHLNPIFGAWLMGWPSAWVIAEPHASSALATASWRSKLRQELSSLCGARGE